MMSISVAAFLMLLWYAINKHTPRTADTLLKKEWIELTLSNFVFMAKRSKFPVNSTFFTVFNYIQYSYNEIKKNHKFFIVIRCSFWIFSIFFLFPISTKKKLQVTCLNLFICYYQFAKNCLFCSLSQSRSTLYHYFIEKKNRSNWKKIQISIKNAWKTRSFCIENCHLHWFLFFFVYFCFKVVLEEEKIP